ncbi:unnamed protein product, partial [Discosporangium mesarthrocarpum]
GLQQELEGAEAMDRTYPETEGFCCLMQELVLRSVPHRLGQNQRGGFPGGIQAYVSYLLDKVLLPERQFHIKEERWRIVARVLQVFTTLVRRYPLDQIGSSGGARWVGEDGDLATPEDVEECRLDFEDTGGAQHRSKSPGYFLLHQV